MSVSEQSTAPHMGVTQMVFIFQILKCVFLGMTVLMSQILLYAIARWQKMLRGSACMQATLIRKISIRFLTPQLNRSVFSMLMNTKSVDTVFRVRGLRKAHNSCANDFWITWKMGRCRQESWVMRLCFRRERLRQPSIEAAAFCCRAPIWVW